MVQRAVRRSISSVDPMFNIPDGVDELVYTDDGDSVEDSEAQVVEEDYLTVDEQAGSSVSDSQYEADDQAPMILSVEQTVKRSADGTQSIDVVLIVEDIIGATDYEVRLAKV